MYSHDDHFASPPDDLDPDRHRIICQHFLGINPEELRQLRRLVALVNIRLKALASDMEVRHA